MLVSQRVETLFDAGAFDVPESTRTGWAAAEAASRSGVYLSVHEDLSRIEAEWRAFEQVADCTAFQTFDWLSTWLRHIGRPQGVRPAIVVGRDRGDGAIRFIFPFAVEGTAIRQLRWLASDLCDYNAPLLAPGFGEPFDAAALVALCRDIEALLAANPRLRHDAIELTKMPAMVGRQANPFVRLPVTVHPSGAYLTKLGGAWDSFYFEKRSSATRRRDRVKRKRLGEIGTVGYAAPNDDAGKRRVLDVLFAQKARVLARKGVADLLGAPQCAAFFKDIATNPAMRDRIHVSRLDVGDTVAATNFGLVFHGRYYHVLAGYDDGAVAKYGPGAAHLHDLMRAAIERGCHEFDFTIGDEAYKREWADVELVLYDHRAAVTVRGLARAIPGSVMARAKRAVKQRPMLLKAASRARALAGRHGGKTSE